MTRLNKLLIITFIILNLYIWVVFNEDTLGLPKVLKYALSIFAFLVIVLFRIKSPLKINTLGLFYPIFLIFILWSIVVLFLESLNFNNLFYVQRILGQPYFYIPYIIPLIILYSKFDLEFFSYFFKYSYILLIPGILIQLILIATGISQTDWPEQVSRVGIFDLGGSFILLTAQLSGKRRVFTVGLVFTLLMALIYLLAGRRGMMIEYVLVIMAMAFIRFRSTLLSFSDRVKMYFAIIITILLIVSFGYILESSYAFQRGGFSKSAVEESRGMVFYDFFYDFRSKKDWIFGRGIEGRVLRSINLEVGTSDIIENGFLTLLLKGGLLYTIPFSLILLRATYFGFVHSKNELVKALAALTFIYLIMMLYFNVPIFSTKYIFLWISVSGCFSKTLRNYTDKEVGDAIKLQFEKT